jgi:MYXO-CTERM domain-containing protein
MYFAMLPFGLQATLEADDRAGAAALYPVDDASECSEALDCDPGFDCLAVEGAPGEYCQDLHAPAGSACNKDFIDCADMCWVSLSECSQVCLFQNLDYSQGYCAPLCGEGKPPCPQGFACQAAGGGVEVCQGQVPDPEEDVVDEELTIADDLLEETSDDLDGGDLGDAPEDTVDELTVPDQVLADSAALDSSPQPPGQGRASSGGCATTSAPASGAGLGLLTLVLLLALGLVRKLV